MPARSCAKFMQRLKKPTFLKIVLAITQGCAMLERNKYMFKDDIAPPWWPSTVTFKHYSNRTKAELEAILTALIAESKRQEELQTDIGRELYHVRRK